MNRPLYQAFIMSLLLLLLGCSSARTVADTEELETSSTTAEELAALLHNYDSDLTTLTGSGRAIVSEPGNSDRVTLQFLSDRDKSLITVRTSVGIEGGQIFVDRDSLTIYNKVDNYAEKVSLRQSNLSSVGSLASINMLDLFNFTIGEEQIDQIFDDGNYFVALLHNGAVVKISRSDGYILDVQQNPEITPAPYSRIEYEGYARIEDFYLPRKITIFSSDGLSRATFLVQQLQVNQTLPALDLDLPDDIPILRP